MYQETGDKLDNRKHLHLEYYLFNQIMVLLQAVCTRI